MPRRANKGNDPLLETSWWRRTVRQHWIKQHLPCALCGQPIHYGPATRYLPGTRKINPHSLVVGHIIGRDEGRRAGMSDAQIMHIQNTRPECARCSSRTGAQYGNRIRHQQQQQTVTLRLDDW